MAGMAWGGMPEHLITKELKSGELVPVHVEGIEPRLAQMFLIRRTDKPVGVASDAIWQALQKLSPAGF
jgi:DNA-binding transcriptional LysR family regulator